MRRLNQRIERKRVGARGNPLNFGRNAAHHLRALSERLRPRSRPRGICLSSRGSAHLPFNLRADLFDRRAQPGGGGLHSGHRLPRADRAFANRPDMACACVAYADQQLGRAAKLPHGLTQRIHNGNHAGLKTLRMLGHQRAVFGGGTCIFGSACFGMATFKRALRLIGFCFLLGAAALQRLNLVGGANPVAEQPRLP